MNYFQSSLVSFPLSALSYDQSSREKKIKLSKHVHGESVTLKLEEVVSGNDGWRWRWTRLLGKTVNRVQGLEFSAIYRRSQVEGRSSRNINTCLTKKKKLVKKTFKKGNYILTLWQQMKFWSYNYNLEKNSKFDLWKKAQHKQLLHL